VPWAMRAHHAQIALSRLSDQHARQMVTGVAVGAGLAEEVIDTVVKRTDGVPLFAEELTDSCSSVTGVRLRARFLSHYTIR